MNVEIPNNEDMTTVKVEKTSREKEQLSKPGAARVIQRFWRQHIVSLYSSLLIFVCFSVFSISFYL